jgi:hypothetical protein
LQETEVAAARERDPGMEMKVIVEVSVATIENATAHQGTERSPRK